MRPRVLHTLLACLATLAAARAQSPDRPNFVVLLADDLGDATRGIEAAGAREVGRYSKDS